MQVKINDLKKIILRTEDFVKKEISSYDSGHDWFHINRVRNNARYLREKEGGNPLVIELSALVHDVGDPKFYQGDETIAEKKISDFFSELNLDSISVGQVLKIVKSLSFKGGKNPKIIDSKEFMVVQDADRLDAIGAIGIARAFNFGGYRSREIYNPDVDPRTYQNYDEYRTSTAPTINHFYEKLLLLKNLMNTETAKKLAERRHKFMEKYLEEFYHEWNLGEKK